MRMFRSISLSVVVLAMLAAGCQSSGTAASPAMGMQYEKAVVVNNNHGGTLVYVPTANGSGVQALTGMGTAEPECKECKADAANYFKTGHIDAVCSVCGAHRTVVAAPH
jgi:hypothetical protein